MSDDGAALLARDGLPPLREVIRRHGLEARRALGQNFLFDLNLTAKIARGRWRIFEVGISYSGRTYDEGKKIGWRDGVRAVYCIIRYSPIGDRLRRYGL